MEDLDIVNRGPDPHSPWFFISEISEKNGDLVVKCRLRGSNELKTYFVIFSLDTDEYGAFQIKGIYTENQFNDLEPGFYGSPRPEIFYRIDLFTRRWFAEERPFAIASGGEDLARKVFLKRLSELFASHFPLASFDLSDHDDIPSSFGLFYDHVRDDDEVMRKTLIRVYELYLKYSDLILDFNRRVSRSKTIPDISFDGIVFFFQDKGKPIRSIYPIDSGRITLGLDAGILLDPQNDIFDIGAVAREAGYCFINRIQAAYSVYELEEAEELMADWAAVQLLGPEETERMVLSSLRAYSIAGGEDIPAASADRITVVAEENGIDNEEVRSFSGYCSTRRHEYRKLYKSLKWQGEHGGNAGRMGSVRDERQENGKVSPAESKKFLSKEITGMDEPKPFAKMKRKVFRYISRAFSAGTGPMLKRTLAITAFTVIVAFSWGAHSDASVRANVFPDIHGIASDFLDKLPADTTETYIELAQNTGIDIKTLMSVELTEVNHKGVLEISNREQARRMTSKKGAVGAWQLMPGSAGNVNKYLEEIKKREKKGKYIGRLDRQKLAIISGFGFGDGIDLKKIDHNVPEYDADYNRRAAAMILTVNRYSLGRLKLLKNRHSKGWHFRIRGEGEEQGFDLEEAVLLSHNLSLEAVKNALRKGGPEKYLELIPGETKVFYSKVRAYRNVLGEPDHAEKLTAAVSGVREEPGKKIEKESPRETSKVSSAEAEKEKRDSEVRFYLGIMLTFFIGCFAELSVLLSGIRGNMMEEGKSLMRAVKKKAGVFPKKQRTLSRAVEKTGAKIKTISVKTAKSVKKTAGLLRRGKIKHSRRRVRSYLENSAKRTGKGPGRKKRKSSVSESVRRVGMMLSPPVEKYTLYVCTGLCSLEEFTDDKVKFASRFDLRLVRRDRASAVAEHVLRDIMWNDMDPETVVVQLPAVDPNNEYIEDIEKLQEYGVRFITVDTLGFRSEFPADGERKRYRRDIYALMLLIRKLQRYSDDRALIGLMRSLFESYAGEGKKFEIYLQALLMGDVPALLKTVLVYRPLDKLVDDLGNRWDSKALVFA
jgi:hypothetical protein